MNSGMEMMFDIWEVDNDEIRNLFLRYIAGKDTKSAGFSLFEIFFYKVGNKMNF
jgi:hypothetical protein